MIQFVNQSNDNVISILHIVIKQAHIKQANNTEHLLSFSIYNHNFLANLVCINQIRNFKLAHFLKIRHTKLQKKFKKRKKNNNFQKFELLIGFIQPKP